MKVILGMPLLWLLLLLLTMVALLIVYWPLHRKVPKQFGLFFVPSFIGAAFLLYAILGASAKLQEKEVIDSLMTQVAVLVSDPQIKPQKIIDKLDQIATRIQNAPFALGRLATLYQEIGHFDKAILVLSRAMVLSPDPEFQIQWIYNHSLKNQGKLEKEVRSVAEDLIEKDSNLLILINLLAIDDYFQGNYAKAIQEWQEILRADESLTLEKRKTIEQAVLKATQALGDEKPIPANTLTNPQLTISVKLSPLIASRVAPNDMLFIFVKSNQNNVPIAVVKKLAKDLPLTVVLNNQDAMMPGQHLVVGMKVRVFAKIVKSQDPLNKKNEVRGSTALFMVESRNKPIDIMINELNG